MSLFTMRNGHSLVLYNCYISTSRMVLHIELFDSSFYGDLGKWRTYLHAELDKIPLLCKLKLYDRLTTATTYNVNDILHILYTKIGPNAYIQNYDHVMTTLLKLGLPMCKATTPKEGY